jgi:hypothetical protein
MKKYIEEMKETIQDCWDIDNMSKYYRDKLQNSLNCIETEFLKLHKHIVVGQSELLCPICQTNKLVDGNCKSCTDELCKPFPGA